MMTEKDFILGKQFEIDAVENTFKNWYTIAEIIVILGILSTTFLGVHIIFSASVCVAVFALFEFVKHIIVHNCLVFLNITNKRICVDSTYRTHTLQWQEIAVVVVSKTHINILTRSKGRISARLKNIKNHEELLECLKVYAGNRYITKEQYLKLKEAAKLKK